MDTGEDADRRRAKRFGWRWVTVALGMFVVALLLVAGYAVYILITVLSADTS